MNPSTRLWEFYDLASAWDGRSDPRAIDIPTHRPDGSIGVTEETGVVFVLLPGCVAELGSQRLDRGQALFDPDTTWGNWRRRADLAPFFIARHELTQSQWARLAPSDWTDSERWPSTAVRRTSTDAATSPVESVSWPDSVALLKAWGLCLPTEAQWEYACRAHSDCPWAFGDRPESVAAQATLNVGTNLRPRPVGTYPPNAFGLFDVHGNVGEWCADVYSNRGPEGSATAERPGDGLRPGGMGVQRAHRGGSWLSGTGGARTAQTTVADGNQKNSAFGLRAARALRP